MAAPADRFFPPRTWAFRRTLYVGLQPLHAHDCREGDVALSANRLEPGVLLGDTVITVSPHAHGYWLRGRFLCGAVDVRWQMRRRHDGRMELRTTGYHDELGPAVCECVGGRAEAYEYLVRLHPGFAAFAAAARAAITHEVGRRTLPRRLLELLSPGVKGALADLVDVNTDHELPVA